jgi:hypothetical protein
MVDEPFKLLIVDSIMANFRLGALFLPVWAKGACVLCARRCRGPAVGERAAPYTPAPPAGRTDFVGRGELSERQQKLGVMMAALKKVCCLGEGWETRWHR